MAPPDSRHVNRRIEADITSHTVEGDHGVALHVVEAGRGPVLVLVPGWTMSWTVFERQIPALSQRYRVIAFDPRSQGRSSTTLEGNTYPQHGRDLERVVDVLGVERFSLAGWSWGGLDAYAYLEHAGSARVDRLIVIDSSPCSLMADASTGWGDFTTETFPKFGKAITENRARYADQFVESMISEPLSAADRSWLMQMHLTTTTPVATTLAVSAVQSDYTSIAEGLEGKLPVLQAVRAEDLDRASAWLAKRTPNAQVVSIPSHLGFWEDAAGFNSAISRFLVTS